MNVSELAEKTFKASAYLDTILQTFDHAPKEKLQTVLHRSKNLLSDCCDYFRLIEKIENKEHRDLIEGLISQKKDFHTLVNLTIENNELKKRLDN